MARHIFASPRAGGQPPGRGGAGERPRLVAIAAALLHDVGHGPFSHLYEKVFNDRRHEEWTRLIIRHARGEAGRLPRPEGVVEGIPAGHHRTHRPPVPPAILSSQPAPDPPGYPPRRPFLTRGGCRPLH